MPRQSSSWNRPTSAEQAAAQTIPPPRLFAQPRPPYLDPARAGVSPTPGLVMNDVFRGAWPPVGPVPPPGVLCFHVGRDDLDMAPFDRMGGLGRMFQLFGYHGDPPLAGLNGALAGCPPTLSNVKPDAEGRVSPHGGGSNSPGEGTRPTT